MIATYKRIQHLAIVKQMSLLCRTGIAKNCSTIMSAGHNAVLHSNIFKRAGRIVAWCCPFFVNFIKIIKTIHWAMSDNDSRPTVL